MPAPDTAHPVPIAEAFYQAAACVADGRKTPAEALASDDARRTLPAGIIRFMGPHSVDYSLVFSALTITAVPILVFYFVCQKQLIRGLAATALD